MPVCFVYYQLQALRLLESWISPVVRAAYLLSPEPGLMSEACAGHELIEEVVYDVYV